MTVRHLFGFDSGWRRPDPGPLRSSAHHRRCVPWPPRGRGASTHGARFALGLCLALAAWPCRGDVFWKRPASADAVLPFAAEWPCLYRSDVRINGGRAHLDVLNGAGDLSAVMRRLSRGFADATPRVAFQQTESVGLGVVERDGRVYRLVALAAGARAASLVFVLTQSPEEYERSCRPPTASALPDLPAYPGSAWRASLEDRAARACLEVAAAEAAPETVRDHLDAALTADGWRRLPPSAPERGPALYGKGAAVCAVLVAAGARPGETLITLLHKRQGME